MTIQLKVARTPKELDDVLWIRHEVFVVEDGRYGGRPLPSRRIVDRFDVIPDVVHLIAYEGTEPVGTLRVNCDRGRGLPAEEYCDYSGVREIFKEELTWESGREPVVISGGMLAVRKTWRMRRDVIRALYKIPAGIAMSWNATHIIATVSHETVAMYRRLGFNPVGPKQWVAEIENHVIPLAARAQDYYAWAFGEVTGPPLEIFRDSYERLLLRTGEIVFHEGDPGNRAYIIDSGNIKISRTRPDGSKLILAVLGRGDMFGELALIDELPRSASAESLGDVELISLDREDFSDRLGMDSKHLRSLMHFLSARMRKTDDLAMVLAFEAPERRLEFALDTIRTGARPDAKRPEVLVARVVPEDLARAALVENDEAVAFLQRKQEEGTIKLRRHSIRFLA